MQQCIYKDSSPLPNFSNKVKRPLRDKNPNITPSPTYPPPQCAYEFSLARNSIHPPTYIHAYCFPCFDFILPKIIIKKGLVRGRFFTFHHYGKKIVSLTKGTPFIFHIIFLEIINHFILSHARPSLVCISNCNSNQTRGLSIDHTIAKKRGNDLVIIFVLFLI